MKKWNPKVVRGEQLIALLGSLEISTLKQILDDLGDETFANCDLIRIVASALEFKKKVTIENLDTISVEQPEFWDEA